MSTTSSDGGRRRLLYFGGLLAVAVVVSWLAIVVVNRQLHRPRLGDPPGTVIGNEQTATRFAAAAFATGLVVSDDGEIFFAEHLTGRIVVLVPGADGALEEHTFAEVELPEGGRLFHLALHPDWPSTPYLYATAHQASAAGVELAVLRIHSTDLVGDAVEAVISNLPAEDLSRGAEADHHGSALAFCGNHLFVTVGDTDSPGPGSRRPGNIRARAQSLDDAEGKVLRYRLDGEELEPDGVIGTVPGLFAIGLRNTFAMDCDPSTGSPLIADNGDGGHDQVRLVEPGSNHGWPLSDERLDPTPPLFDSERARIAPTGIIARVDGQSTELLLSVFHAEAIYRLMLDADGVANDHVEVVHRSSGSILAIADDDGGCVYFATGEGLWLLDDTGCDRTFEPTGGTGTDLARFAVPPAEIFRANCSPCHGLDREGGGAPALLPSDLTESDDFYVQTILNGREGGMPSWGAAGMSEEQARAMLDYLRSAPE